ncbi:selenocysteine lyase/cysteine desulfurase [Sediminihabitans luteus]|uniref:Selenocysteine lyase/cysteine desulfurase n=1 Tax=Sediminihabitans luteus TaxID=1138585 RepID=A0A2M9D0F1_9CELL|nr:aminotransferase class V-fold PLP-dependent enzyme [Sediminihabitans luteus]PJJ77630.1 selenocysteine lyase/cysteine desulfurase [Sediminihabitans luteus]GII98530.1 putative aminotransferase/cysteine desulfurase [Sediminihabitans luteus]
MSAQTIDTTCPSAPGTVQDVAPVLPVASGDTFVPLVDGTSVRYANLDVAASAPALASVAARVSEVLPLYASVHRGAGYLSQVSTALYEASRQSIGAFVGARADDVTIVTRNTTDSLNLLAGCVPAQADGTPGRVLVLDVEHHANFLPWQRTGAATVLTGGATVAATLDAIEGELARTPYALLAVTGASNVTGESLPVADLVRLAHDAGARVLLDGAQLVPHRRFSLEATGVDYVAFSGHKTYAPFGAGALVGRRDWLDTGTPFLAGGGAVRNVRVDATTWHPAPARHEAGSPNVIGAVALAAACEALATVDPASLAEHEATLRARLVDGLDALEGVHVVHAWDDATDPVGVVTFVVEDHDPGLVAAYLSAEHGIGVRDGRFCAHPLLSRLGLDGGAIRASVGVGTAGEEVERLIGALASFVADGPRAQYAIVENLWTVVDDPRPVPAGSGLSGLFATAAAGFIAESAGCGPLPADG